MGQPAAKSESLYIINIRLIICVYKYLNKTFDMLAPSVFCKQYMYVSLKPFSVCK